jgi:hypothetical protein
LLVSRSVGGITPASFVEQFQFVFKVFERALQEYSMPLIAGRFQLLQHSLAREAQTLPLALAGSCFAGQLGTTGGVLLTSIRLLCFNRFALPPTSHVLIIVREHEE